jgi:hypothetical protein
MTNIVGTPCDPALLPLDHSVEVIFEALNDKISLPLFKLAGDAR